MPRFATVNQGGYFANRVRLICRIFNIICCILLHFDLICCFLVHFLAHEQIVLSRDANHVVRCLRTPAFRTNQGGSPKFVLNHVLGCPICQVLLDVPPRFVANGYNPGADGFHFLKSCGYVHERGRTTLPPSPDLLARGANGFDRGADGFHFRKSCGDVHDPCCGRTTLQPSPRQANLL